MSKKDFIHPVEEMVSEDAVQPDVVQTDAEKLERFKKMKREAAERFKERRAKEKIDRIENAKALIDELKNGGYWDNISEKSRSFLIGIANPTNAAGGNQSLFRTLFGDNPSIGATVTLNEAFQKTLKGKSNLDFYIKKWADKGTIVSFKQDADNILNSVYVLESIGGTAPSDV